MLEKTNNSEPLNRFNKKCQANINFEGKIVYDKTKTYISNIDPKKRPIAAVADNNEIRNIAKVKIIINKRIKCKLLFDSK